MSATHSIKIIGFCMLFWGLILSSLLSCSTKEDILVDKIVKFQSCLESKPQKLKGKICNAYVSSYEEEIPELIHCLLKENINTISYDKDNSGNVFRIQVSFNCKSGREFMVQFGRSDSSKEYDIASVGEIVY